MSIRSRPVPRAPGTRLLLALAVVAALITIQAIISASPALAMTERPHDTDMTNGEVYATALSEDGETLYIGGKFTRVKDKRSDGITVGRATNNLAAIDVRTGNMIRTWRPKVTGDPAVVRSLAVKDSRVYIGGNFTHVDGQGETYERTNLAAVNAVTGSVVPNFAPVVGGGDSYVYALEADDSKLYAGGGFSKVGNQPRKNLAAFSLVTSSGNQGELDPNWHPATSSASTCTEECSSKVRSLKLGPLGTSIFVGGSFSEIAGPDGTQDARQSVARLYTDTGDLHPWKIPAGTIDAPQTAWDLAWADGKLFVGFGATQNYLAAFNIKPGSLGGEVWRRGTTGNVQSVELTPDASRLFFGGHFGLNNIPRKKVCGDKPLRGLASVNLTRLDPSNWEIHCDFVPSLDQRDRPSYEGAWTMITTRSYLWVGGGFIGVSDSADPQPDGKTDVPQTNLARFGL